MAGLMNQAGWGEFFYHGYFSDIRSSDPWYLFHVLLSPLSKFEQLTMQTLVILGTMTAMGCAFLYLCRPLKLSSVTTAVLLSILLLGNMQFLLRGFLARPALLQSAITLAVLAALLHRHWIVLFVLLIASTLLSHLFIIPLLLSLCAVCWLVSLKEHKFALHIFLLSIAAVALGLWLHPHTTNYVHYLITVFTKLPFLMQLDIGTEMMGGAGREASLLAVLAVTFLMIAIAQKKEGIGLYTLHKAGITLLIVVVLVMLIAFYKWVRMIDFLWPLTIALVVLTISLKHDLPKQALTEIIHKKAQKNQTLLLILLIIFSTHVVKLTYIYWTEDASHSQGPILAAMEQLPEGTNVLNIDWDLFPMLMNARPDLQYARGMDPGFNYVVDERSEKLFLTIDSTSTPEIWLDDALEIFEGSDAIVLWADRRPQLLRFFQSADLMTPIYPQEKIAVFLLK